MSSNSENQVDFVERVCVNQLKLKSGLKSQYDFIVCGSGSSGSVVVPDSREKPSWPASSPTCCRQALRLNVTEPDVHISGNTAWIAYLNKGSITGACGTTNQKWLESGFLRKPACIWKIVFMHSTRVHTLPQENRGEIK